MSVVDFVRLGFNPDYVPYELGISRQRAVHHQVVAGERTDTVLLLEHEPVYTAGKRTELAELPFDGSSYVETDRGGKITWHGPGQLVGYPIMRLPQPIDVVAYVRWLEQVLIDNLQDLGITGYRRPKMTGVWVDDQFGPAKIAAIGIRVANKVTMHGFALNCNNSLAPFENIIACGLEGARTSSATAILGREVTPLEIAEKIEMTMGAIPSGRF
ncbi:MAG: hypothetical protein RL198_16 [Actinomycetota bacterium]